MSLEEIRIQISFKEQRTYIRGADLFDTMFRIAGEAWGTDPVDMRFVARRPIRQNAILLRSSVDEGWPSSESVALFDFAARGRRHIIGAWPDPDDRSNDWREMQTDGAVVGDISGNVLTAATQTGRSLLGQWVDLNKALLRAVFPMLDSQWIFVRLDLAAYPGVANSSRLTARTLAPSRIYQTDIAVNSEEIGRIFFMERKEF
jgi:hypothetical protein